MADLTVLSSSSLPLYPLLSASRSSFFNNYVPGASSSRVNLVQQSDVPVERTREKPPPLQVPRRRTEEDDENQEENLSPSSDDEPEPQMSSPDSYAPSSLTANGWNRSGNSWQLDSSATLTPKSRGRTKIQHHRPTRSRSAPPTRMTFQDPTTKPFTAAPDQSTFDLHRIRRFTSGSSYTSGTDSGPSSPSSSFSSPVSSYGYGKNGDLLRPPPPLHRPTTFWRRNPRSGVTASSYSPSSHLIRRSTFVAAGLPFDRPMADLSALGVESRVKAQFDEDNARAKVSEVFWEVVVQR
ncbi:hypothetical protein GYMLUDRAFT_40356 [Collybiopsis luxurians FD-317 M1]|uniref:Uncharacterized protein n=1 Tax=Collybiopsis luxurians FD-317 M1 TaxID=944289 RepID=A0A0D0C7F7_9AGAR|nr:hypothetical protein GYMLUDRAFT_40356 [Collybiopsis luxurians FD-317 M1]